MYEEKKLTSPYINSLINTITICENNLKKLNKEKKVAKIRTIIIIITTLITTFTILKPFFYFSLIGSSLINLIETYRLKKELYSIKKRGKAIKKINKYLNLEMELAKNNKVKNISDIKKFSSNMGRLTDLYECMLTNDINFLEKTTEKYEVKSKKDLITLNEIKNNNVPLSNSSTMPITKNNSIIVPQYYQPTKREKNTNGQQYVKKII